jgi:hypothetical protein
MSEWQPIETAPQDAGAFILLFCPEDNSTWFASWQGGQWYGVDDCGLRRIGMGPDDEGGWRASHWMPLPEWPKDTPTP